MSTYELDDDLVRAWIHFTANEVAVEEVELREAFEKQLPIPVPTKIGAVVRVAKPVSERHLMFTRIATDGHTAFPWIALNDPDYASSSEGIGRITEVLSEGVDL